MADYFYTDADGNRKGPFNKEQLKELAANGIITPTTQLVARDGLKGRASAWYPDLKFSNVSDHTEYAQASPGFFDIGFTRFVMNFYIPYIWVFTIVAGCLGWAFSIIMGLNQLGIEKEPWYGIVTIVVATIALPFSLLFSRMVLEIVIVMFRIETHLRTIHEHYEKK